jgi:hypothetical protein
MIDEINDESNSICPSKQIMDLNPQKLMNNTTDKNLTKRNKSCYCKHKKHDIHLVDNYIKVAEICIRLRDCFVVGFDMEGIRLGRNGVVSLLQIAISPTEIYVFDVLALGQELFSAAFLLPFLSNPNIIKLCYDCRCDSEALFFLHGVQAFGLYDLQIVYTIKFQQRNDPFLKGLHKAIQTPGILTPTEIKSMVSKKLAAKQEWACGDYSSVMQRPLSEEILKYCASDVSHLFKMHQMWSDVPESLILHASHQRMICFLYRTPMQLATQEKTMSRLDFEHILSWYPRHHHHVKNDFTRSKIVGCTNDSRRVLVAK